MQMALAQAQGQAQPMDEDAALQNVLMQSVQGNQGNKEQKQASASAN